MRAGKIYRLAGMLMAAIVRMHKKAGTPGT
ncbi:unknown [Firmicutes bacterium CAG:791]|nr:unknown [Firmicutes bacterium CAG:791]